MSYLEPLEPSEAVKLYLNGRNDAAEKTLEAQKYRLRAFESWCEEEGIINLNDLSGRDLYRYRVWRREGGYSGQEIKNVTLHGDLATLRAFLQFVADVDGVPEDLYEKVPLPRLHGGEDVSASTIEPDRARHIIEYLERYQYASREHIITFILWHTGCRMGALRSLDLGDLDLHGDRGRGGPAIHFVHRPESGTPLKNKEKSERWNSVSSHAAQSIQDYIDGPRVDVLDEQGRSPLVTTDFGRIALSTIRSTLYRVTRPCWIGDPCPHDRDVSTCEATVHGKMSTCPSARSPHDLRSGRVTAFRMEDVDRSLVSDRMNASGEILDKHYDRRGERDKAEQRRRFMNL